MRRKTKANRFTVSGARGSALTDMLAETDETIAGVYLFGDERDSSRTDRSETFAETFLSVTLLTLSCLVLILEHVLEHCGAAFCIFIISACIIVESVSGIYPKKH